MLANDLYYDRFEPPGVSYKGKLIGVEMVHEARGDKMCQEAMNKLKAMVKVSGEHKQRIVLNISTAGVRILDEKTLKEEYLHEVQKISFVSRDPADARAFGIVAGEEGSHRFYAIKTEKAAYNVVLALKELFESVLKAKKRQMEDYQSNKSAVDNTYSVPEVKQRPEPEQTQETVGTEEEEDPSSLYAVPHKKKLDNFENREQSLAELARTVETMQEGLHNMEEFSIAPPPPGSVRRTSRDPLSPTPEVSLEQPFNLTAPPPTRPPPPVPSDPFQSQLMEDQQLSAAPQQQQQSSASEDLFKEFGDTLGSPLKVQQPQQVPSANPFGPPMGSTMNFNSGFGAPMAQQGFGMMQQQQQFAAPSAMHDPFGPPAMGSSNNDLFGGNVLQPANVAPPPAGQTAAPQKPDPFADLGSLGGGGSGDNKKSNKDMFAGFKMAKPGEVDVPNMMGQSQKNDSTSDSETSSSSPETSASHNEVNSESLSSDPSSACPPFVDPVTPEEKEHTIDDLGKGDPSSSVSSAESDVAPLCDSSKSEPDTESHNAAPKLADPVNGITSDENSSDIIVLKADGMETELKVDKIEQSESSVAVQETSASESSVETEEGAGDEKLQTVSNQDSEKFGVGEAGKPSLIKGSPLISELKGENGGDSIDSPSLTLSGTEPSNTNFNTPGMVLAPQDGESDETDIKVSQSDSEQSDTGVQQKISVTSTEDVISKAANRSASLSSENLKLPLQKTAKDNLADDLSSENATESFNDTPQKSSPQLIVTCSSPSPDESLPSPNEPPPDLPEPEEFPSPQVPPPPLPHGFSYPSPDFPPPSLSFDSEFPSPSVPPPPLPVGFQPPSVPVREPKQSAAPPPIPPRQRRNKTPVSLPVVIPSTNTKSVDSDTSHYRSSQASWTSFDDDTTGFGMKFSTPNSTNSLDDAFYTFPSSESKTVKSHASISLDTHMSNNFGNISSKDLFQQVPFDQVALSSSAPTTGFHQSSKGTTHEPFSSSPLPEGSHDPFHHSVPLSSNHSDSQPFLREINSHSKDSQKTHRPPSLPVHDDPFADDPFAVSSPSVTKTFVFDPSQNSHKSSSVETTDPFGGNTGSKQLTTSTGIPLIFDDDPFAM